MSFKCEECHKVQTANSTEFSRNKYRYFTNSDGKPAKNIIYTRKVCRKCYERNGEEIK